MSKNVCRTLIYISVLIFTANNISWGDWPTYNHDKARSGITSEQLPSKLTESWCYQANLPPKPAWPPPAAQDFWHNYRKLRPTVIYDRAFHTVAVRDSVYFASSSDFGIYALNAETGQVRWVFLTAGPVRLA